MTVLRIGAVNKDLTSEKFFAGNHFHNILRLFDVLTNVPFSTSETKRDYY